MSDHAKNQFLYTRFSGLDTTYSVNCINQPELSGRNCVGSTNLTLLTCRVVRSKMCRKKKTLSFLPEVQRTEVVSPSMFVVKNVI